MAWYFERKKKLTLCWNRHDIYYKCSNKLSEAYLEPCQTSAIELFYEDSYVIQSLIIFAKMVKYRCV